VLVQLENTSTNGDEAEVGHGLLDLGNALGQAKERRIDDLQHLGRDRRIGTDQLRDFLHRGIARHHFAQLRVRARHRRQLADAADQRTQARLFQ
jgi:hypothetical protein